MKHRIKIRRQDGVNQRYWVGRKSKIRAFMRTDPDELIAYKRFGKQNIEKLTRLGKGSDREVYALGRDKVIKIARTPRGLAQNEQEKGLNDYFLPDDRKLNVFETGKDYVIEERAERDNKTIKQFLKPLKKFTMNDFKNKTGELQDTMEELGLSDYLNYGLLWEDFKSPRNWGVVKGNPTLIDGGTLSNSTVPTMRQELHPSYKQEWEHIKRERRMFR